MNQECEKVLSVQVISLGCCWLPLKMWMPVSGFGVFWTVLSPFPLKLSCFIQNESSVGPWIHLCLSLCQLLLNLRNVLPKHWLRRRLEPWSLLPVLFGGCSTAVCPAGWIVYLEGSSKVTSLRENEQLTLITAITKARQGFLTQVDSFSHCAATDGGWGASSKRCSQNMPQTQSCCDIG